jgi:hypothetical protein
MGWIKRNLFFVIGLVVAVLLLALAVVYDISSLGHNAAKKDELDAIYATLQNFSDRNPSPGNAQTNNITAANTQTRQLREWIARTGAYFKPIDPVPGGSRSRLNNESFKNALDRTVSQLQHEAVGAGVQLPPDCGFSFTAQRTRVQFAQGSLEPLSVQLGEVKTISEILFAARVNALEGIQRLRVSDDDTAGPQADYINDVPVTNDLAVLTPYTVTFRSFSAELSSVLAGFAASPQGLIVKGINISPAGLASSASATATPTVAPTPTPTLGRGGLLTVLDEQLLRVTLEIEIVKLSRK